MKKIIAFLLAITIMIGLCGCGKSQAVKDVEKAINEIGNVNSESGKKITTAEKLYNDLNDKEKKKVENYATLEYSRKVYDALDSRRYYDAICLYAEYKDYNGVKSVMNKCEFGDKAVLIAVLNNNMVVTYSTNTMPAGATIVEGDNWLFYYSFPTKGLPQRFGLYSEKAYSDPEELSEDCLNLVGFWGGSSDKVLYAFELP